MHIYIKIKEGKEKLGKCELREKKKLFQHQIFKKKREFALKEL